MPKDFKYGALAEFADLPRWVLWREETVGDRRTKVPYQSRDAKASTTNPKTWATLSRIQHSVEFFDGVGIVLGDLGDGRHLIGVDLDACLVDGELLPWAKEIASRFRTYAEVSPSGTGVKIFGTTTDLPGLIRNRVVPDSPPINGKSPEIAVYVDKRYFTVTGRTFGDSDTVEDVTEAVFWLTGELARCSGGNQHQGDLPPAFTTLLKRNAYCRGIWEAGHHQGADKSRSGADAALAAQLGRAELSREDFNAVLTAFQHGQAKELGHAWPRQLDRLWTKFGPTRARVTNGGGISKLNLAVEELAKHPRFQSVAMNTLQSRIFLVEGTAAVDIHTMQAREYLGAQGLKISTEDTFQAIQLIAHQQKFNPLKEHIDALLAWDGQLRLDSWVVSYLGARDTPYVRWIGRKWLIAAIARALEPGCQSDHSLVLIGAQGTGKTTACQMLGGRFYHECSGDLEDKDTTIGLRGKWITEFSDRGATGKADINRFKAFLTRTEDEKRVPYDRLAVVVKRTNVFIITSNEPGILDDPSGARRFWPVQVGRTAFTELQRDRDQLLAEAKVAFKAGEKWWPSGDDPQDALLAAQEQLQKNEEDPWAHTVRSYLNKKLLSDQDFVQVPLILTHLGLGQERQDQRAANRIAAIVRADGWRPERRRIQGVKVRGYARPRG